MHLKPLRERREDIAELVHHFLKEFSLKFHKPMTGVTNAAMDVLCRHGWPGNVRELRNAVERAVILEESDQLTEVFLPEQLAAATGAPKGAVPLDGFTLPPGGVSLERVEESLVRQAIAMSGGNQTRAAQFLDVSRDVLRYKLKKFGIET
jgi:DNA-binding NtrC family response regulator